MTGCCGPWATLVGTSGRRWLPRPCRVPDRVRSGCVGKSRDTLMNVESAFNRAQSWPAPKADITNVIHSSPPGGRAGAITPAAPCPTSSPLPADVATLGT